MAEEMLRTESLVRVFGQGERAVYALGGVSLSIYKGGLTILNGKSGSGKTTLLNLLSALDTPTSGKVWFEGKELSDLPIR